MTIQGSSSQMVNEMNVTPLIDVLLVLLIIFMVITPLTPKGLDALLPEQKTPAHKTETSRTVIIQLMRDPATMQATVQVNSESVSWETLEGRLKEVFANRAERVTFVKADESLDFAQVAEAIDIAHAAGIDKVGLMSTPR